MLVVKDDDFGFEDDVLGVGEVDLSDAECIQNPRQTVHMSIRLLPGDSLGNAEDLKARAAGLVRQSLQDWLQTCTLCIATFTQELHECAGLDCR